MTYSGYAVEAWAGASRLSPTENTSAAATDGAGVSVGVSLAVEVDYLRTASMGAGLAYISTTIPRDDGGPGRHGSAAAQYDVSSAFTRLGTDHLRPRMYAGVFLGGQGESNSVFGAYGGAGASFHPARGTAVHVFTGPQVIGLEKGDEPGDSLSYSGVGWAVRVRFYRNFFRGCDVLPSVGQRDAPRPARCD